MEEESKEILQAEEKTAGGEPGKKDHSLLKRVITAVILLGALCAVLFWLRQIHPIFVDIIIVLFALIGVFEVMKAFKNRGLNPMYIPVFFTACIIYPLTYFFQETGILISVIAGTMACSIQLIFGKKFGMRDAACSIFTLIYPLAIMMLLVLINNVKGEILGILLILSIAVLTDTFAFFVGKLFGKRKLCPEISPKKTVAGAVGGMIGGIIGALIIFAVDATDGFLAFEHGILNTVDNLHLVDEWQIALPVYIVAGILGGAMCQLGDLTASVIKRKMGIKDFGRIFPGHGGVMDRLDGILFVIPVVYLILLSINTAVYGAHGISIF